MKTRKFALVTVVALLSRCVLLSAWSQQQTSKVFFSFRGPGVKTPMIGSLYSADESGAVSLSLDPDMGKTVSIPFTKIKDIILTPTTDRFSHAVIHLTEGGTKTGKIVAYTVLFINPQTDKAYDLPLSAPDDTLADFGNRQMVNCAVGTFTRQR